MFPFYVKEKIGEKRNHLKNDVPLAKFVEINDNDVYVQQPFHCEIEHKLGMTCLTTGPVTCRVRLDRGGYVPGEAINIWATIDNQSKVTVKGTRSTLTEVIV